MVSVIGNRLMCGGLAASLGGLAGCGGGASGFGASKSPTAQKQADSGTSSDTAGLGEGERSTPPQQVSGAYLVDCATDSNLVVPGSAPAATLVGCRLTQNGAKVDLTGVSPSLMLYSTTVAADGAPVSGTPVPMPTVAMPASSPFHMAAAMPYTDHGTLDFHVPSGSAKGDYTLRSASIGSVLGSTTLSATGMESATATGVTTGASPSAGLIDQVGGIWSPGPALWKGLDSALNFAFPTVWSGVCNPGGVVNNPVNNSQAIVSALSGLSSLFTGQPQISSFVNKATFTPSASSSVCFRAFQEDKSFVQFDSTGGCYYLRACDDGSHNCSNETDQTKDVVYVISTANPANKAALTTAVLDAYASSPQHACTTATKSD